MLKTLNCLWKMVFFIWIIELCYYKADIRWIIVTSTLFICTVIEDVARGKNNG